MQSSLTAAFNPIQDLKMGTWSWQIETAVSKYLLLIGKGDSPSSLIRTGISSESVLGEEEILSVVRALKKHRCHVLPVDRAYFDETISSMELHISERHTSHGETPRTTFSVSPGEAIPA